MLEIVWTYFFQNAALGQIGSSKASAPTFSLFDKLMLPASMLMHSPKHNAVESDHETFLLDL